MTHGTTTPSELPCDASAETTVPQESNPSGSALDRFSDCCGRSGLDVLFRRDAPERWQEVLDQSGYVPVLHTPAMLDYQLSYFSGTDPACADASLIILHDRKPCAVWPLMLAGPDASHSLSTVGSPLVSPLFRRDAPAKTVKSIVTRCHALAASYTGGAYVGQELFIAAQGLSEWYLQTVRAGAVAAIGHEMFIDLALPMQEIRTAFRKSYKPLISMGERLWSATVCSNTSAEIWDEFRCLHREVAGRSTRSQESWARQHEAIAAGNAFFVYLRDTGGRMVGGGLFHVSRDEGLYAVGAYDRALFDKPLGHLVQHHAIIEMKRRGLKWYKIGSCAYPGDRPSPSAKEIAISHFKQGFATHHFAALRFELAAGATDQ